MCLFVFVPPRFKRSISPPLILNNISWTLSVSCNLQFLGIPLVDRIQVSAWHRCTCWQCITVKILHYFLLWAKSVCFAQTCRIVCSLCAHSCQEHSAKFWDMLIGFSREWWEWMNTVSLSLYVFCSLSLVLILLLGQYLVYVWPCSF